jgi:hypothetical protein
MQAMGHWKEGWLKGYWKGNLPQVLDVPYHPLVYLAVLC